MTDKTRSDHMKPEKKTDEEPQVFVVSRQVNQVKFTRRRFMEFTAAAAAATGLAACDEFGNPIAISTPGTTRTPTPLGTPTATGTAAPAAANTPTPMATNTSVPGATNTSTPTATHTPTPTNTPTQTSTPTLTPTPVPECVVQRANVNLRAGPGTNYAILDVLNQGDVLQAIGRNSDSSWVQVKTGKHNEAWIATFLVECSSPIEGLPLATNIPTPLPSTNTPAPTDTPVPAGTPGTVPAGETGLEYKIDGQTYTLPCGSPLPAGVVCTCNCVSMPAICTCDAVTTHYWYPN